jgi:hypothetical protein
MNCIVCEVRENIDIIIANARIDDQVLSPSTRLFHPRLLVNLIYPDDPYGVERLKQYILQRPAIDLLSITPVTVLHQ